MIPIFSNSLGKEELKALKSLFKTRWLGYGRQSQLLEKEFGEKIGSRMVAGVNSCTSALFLSIKALGIKKGDEVIVPTVNYVGCANAILDVGAKPVFADVDLNYLNIIPSEIKRLRTKKTKAVLLVHYGGHPCDMDAIKKYAKGLYVIEDSANSPFSKYKGKNCGTIGDIGCFSFDSMKVLAAGDAGAMVFKNYHHFLKAQAYRDLGMVPERRSGTDSMRKGIKRWWEIELACISDSTLTNDIMSAIVRVQLKKVDGFIKRRKEIWNRYQKELSGLDWLETPPEPLPDTISSYYFYWLKIKSGKRDEFAKHLVDNGIYCTFRYYPLHLIKYYKSKQRLPNAEKLNNCVINIPLHQNLTDKEINYIVKTVKKFKKNIKA